MGEAERRLAGILAADVVGYSAMVGTDEHATLARVRSLRADIVEPLVAAHGGRLFKTTGDGFFAAFASAVQALRSAIAIQDRLRGQPDGLRLRIGVHQGEVVPEGDDLLGDGVIIAARLEPLAEPGGICISARVREDAAGKVALEADDLGRPELKNIATSIQVFRLRLDEGEHRAFSLSEKPPSVVLPVQRAQRELPSIAVLPFANMSGDPDQEFFADGLTEDILTALTRYAQLTVIARNSTFVYKGRAVSIADIARDLQVRYVLEGSVRRAGERVRVTAQLLEAETGTHLWADRFDGALEDVFNLQDQITERVVGIVEPSLRQSEIERSRRKHPENLDAYDLYLRALPHMISAMPADARIAADFLKDALKLDPNYAAAHAVLAWCHEICFMRGGHDEADKAAGVRHARAAITSGTDDATALAIAGFVMGYLGKDPKAALGAIERALSLNPSSAARQVARDAKRNCASPSARCIHRQPQDDAL